MQLFTIEQFIEMQLEARELSWSFASSIFGAAWEHVLDAPASIISALAAGDWALASTNIVLLLGGAIILLRLACRFAASFIRGLFD